MADIKRYRGDIGCISRIHELIYVHVPKTGGTTIERSPLFDDARSFHAIGLRKQGTGGQHPTIKQLKAKSKGRGLDSFVAAAHIRHPCERFISAFRYLTSDKCNEGDQRNARNKIGDMNIDEFVLNSYNKRWKVLDRWAHFTRQNTFLVDRDTFEIDYILCQEQWNEGLKRLYHNIGLDKVPSYLLHHDGKGAGKKSNRGHLLKNEHETCADLQPSTRSLLEAYYAMDCCLFDYDEMPRGEEEQCIGTSNTKEDFQVKFLACKEKIAEYNKQNYASIQKKI